MFGRRALGALLSLLVLPAVLQYAAPAHASVIDLIRDCNDNGALDGSYSQRQLLDARKKLATDVDEYGDCRAVVNAALLAKSRDGGKRSTDRSIAVTPAAREKLERDLTADLKLDDERSPVLKLAGETIKTARGDGFVLTSTARPAVPGSMIAAIAGLGLLALGGLGGFATRAARRYRPRVAALWGGRGRSGGRLGAETSSLD